MKSISLFLVIFFASLLALTFAKEEEAKKSSGESEAPTEADSAASDMDMSKILELLKMLQAGDFDGAMKMSEDSKDEGSQAKEEAKDAKTDKDVKSENKTEDKGEDADENDEL